MIPPPRSGAALFYRLVLPLLALVNLALGLFLLAALVDPGISFFGPSAPPRWQLWVQMCSGAFCCAVAGWLGAAGWSKSYWHRTMERQIVQWRRIVDVICGWLEEAPVPVESLRRLNGSIREASTRPADN